MRNHNKNIFDYPETHNLTLVGVADLEEPDYSYYLLAVWKGEEGYYLATDSGCSCPTPFEDYFSVDALTGPLTALQAKEEAISLWSNQISFEPEEFWPIMSRIS